MSLKKILFESLRVPLVFTTGHGYDRPSWLNNFHHKLSYRLHKLLPIFGISGIQRVPVPGMSSNFMYVRAEDGGVAHQLIMYRQYEPYESSLVKEKLKPGMTVYNIGANLGYYVLLGSKSVAESGKVFAFEPEKNNLELLQRTAAENGCTNVEIHPVAVASTSGVRTLSLSKTNSGDHRLSMVGGLDQIQVSSVSVDSFIDEGHPPPDVIIMDVQGSELEAIRGAQNLLDSTRRLVLFTEFWPAGLNEREPNGAKMLLNILEAAGFEFAQIDERKRRLKAVTPELLLKQVTNNMEVNLLAIRP